MYGGFSYGVTYYGGTGTVGMPSPTFTESFGIGDRVQFKLKKYLREPISLGDDFTYAGSYRLTVKDGPIEIGDDVRFRMEKTLKESLSISDRIKLRVKLRESFSVGDALAPIGLKFKEETIGISDNVIIVKNGVTLDVWTRKPKSTSVWTRKPHNN